MKKLATLTLLVGAFAGCPDGGNSNPDRLWLALNGDELHVKLQEAEPNPF
jgi:hypothetical protein